MERDKKTDWCQTCLRREKQLWLDRISKLWLQTRNKRTPGADFVQNDDLMRELFTCLL